MNRLRMGSDPISRRQPNSCCSDDYGVAGLPCPFERTQALAAIPTRLADINDLTQEHLINWGYAICDTAVRRYVVPQLDRAAQFPYPEAAV